MLSNTEHANMKLILFAASIFVLDCSARPLSSVENQLGRLQQSIAAMKQTYDEKISTYDEKISTYDEKIRRNEEKIASLEQQLRSGRTLFPQSGSVYFTSFSLINFHNLKNQQCKVHLCLLFYPFQWKFRLRSLPI